MELPDLLVTPHIVTIGGKLCALRAITAAEHQELRLRGFGDDRYGTREWMAEALVLMFGVERGAALDYVDEETARMQRAVLAGGWR